MPCCLLCCGAGPADQRRQLGQPHLSGCPGRLVLPRSPLAVEIDRVFLLASPRNPFSGPLILPICLRSEVSRVADTRTSPCVRQRRRRGLGEAPSLGPQVQAPARGSSTHAPPARPHGAPSAVLPPGPLVGGGALGTCVTLSCVLWGFAGLCSAYSWFRGGRILPGSGPSLDSGCGGVNLLPMSLILLGTVCLLHTGIRVSSFWKSPRPESAQMSRVPILEGHTLQRVQCRRLALRPPEPCARATGAASPWGTAGVPRLAHESLSRSTRGLQLPLCHGVSGQRGMGGLSGAPCAARPRAGTPGAPAASALLACGSRDGLCDSPLLVASEAAGSSSVGNLQEAT
ncbi:uncharacterized protein LOC111730561 isoform X2 [Pteropus vampyrus]|uniref:Uncharacterized protein LOC111730561 isoform X1 n=1 Tax=Pteropus vampyrus TaxID=132908 RepID=A0A6P6BRB7_PTEVA|nr:uncharacterized protein LOC111730561 isoform X1 [Pteropus vampyrus]XP_023377634.1 uncharacterized protein LOC111730561 isoform X2 [Pteropus vampyrus]